MRVPISITRALMAAALFGLMSLALVGFHAQEKDMEGLREAGKESIYWSSSQSEAELARFVAALGRYALGDPEVTEAEVNKRFDIVWSRLDVFRSGDVGRRMSAFDQQDRVVAELRRLLHRHEREIVELSRASDPARLTTLLSEFTDAGERLRQLSVRILAAEEERLAGVREKVRASARLTWVVSIAALVLALVLIGVTLIETRRYRRMAQESATLAARAESASRAKSRFLTMMSHELRTPMNGVLGLLALVRQTALNERQVRLVDQAERSGQQMSALLGDIPDFSDLQSESLVINRDMFEMAALGEALRDMFAPIVRREGIAFTLDVDPGVPRWVVGDMGRLRQVIGHFITFLVDVVGTRDVHVRIAQPADGVLFEIDVAAPADGGPGWQPEAVFGRTSPQLDEFASDSLGPMIARGLVALMGGGVTLRRPKPGRAVLAVLVPMEASKGPGGCVRIEAESATVQMLLAALLRKLSRPVWMPEGGQEPMRPVEAVLVEAGGDDETACVTRLRSSIHPVARLIAIGTPTRSALFDGVCPQPVTTEALEVVLKPPAKPKLRAL